MFAERKVIPLHTRSSPDTSHAPEFGPNEPDLNLRIVWGLGQWVRDQHGLEVLERLTKTADLSVEQLDGKSHWVSHDRFEAFLMGCRDLMDSDQEFEEACTYRLPDAYGPLKFALWAVSPRLMMIQAAKNMHMVSSISEVVVLEDRGNYLHARYEPQRSESPLMTLSREAQTRAIPTLWGLPKAQLNLLSRNEHGRSEYEVRWRVKLTWIPALAGAALGVLLAAAVVFGVVPSGQFALVVLPLLGAAAGHIFDLHRTNRLNRGYGESQNEALQELASEAVDAQREIFELSQRQQDWVRSMESQVAERTAIMQDVVDRIGKQQEDRHDRLRGVSHDLKSPLQVITSTVDLLRARGDDAEQREFAIQELEQSAGNMRIYLDQLIAVATSEGRFVRHAPTEVGVSDLTDVLRRRLKAFVHAQEVRTSVFKTREAPDRVIVNRVILDRVLDNLLTNAAKYTERGSILVEVGGTPGHLTIKVSDTGRGIEDEKLRAIFVPGGSDTNTRAPRSYGLGLSIVLRLLDEIGGRLEVMSRVSRGTTFWAHFPEAPPDQDGQGVLALDAPYSELLDRVVTIRRS